jgi:hypothetical protein
MSQLSYFVYSQIPGSGKGWALAVLAIGRRDADVYIRNVHRGGKFSHSGGASVQANCGAVTSAAQAVLRERLERWMNETD